MENIYTGSRVSGPRIPPGVTPFPMAWISARTIEFSDVEGRILRWDFRAPHRTVETIRRDVSVPPHRGTQTQVLTQSTSPDANWVLAQCLDPSLARDPPLARAELHDRSTSAATSFQLQNATRCAALLWSEKQAYILHASNGTESQTYQVSRH